MEPNEREEELLRSVALKNASSILRARQAAEEELLEAKEALHQSDERLRESERQLRLLLESEQRARASAEDANRMKDEFLATLSHELRTPLSAILGWAHLLRSRELSPEDLRKGLDTIERNARVQTHLIEDLLDMSRIISGKVRMDVQPVFPAQCIEMALETVRPAADAKGVRLESVLDPLAGPVSGDSSRLQQVIWNLLNNAIKFTARDGRIQVVLARVDSHIEISVADTGAGIAPEQLEHVFERFRQVDSSSTRQFGGLGLGLAIVKNLVELHGGTVHATSEGLGKGSTFTLALPLAALSRTPRPERQRPRLQQAAAIETGEVDLSGIKVLIVDDQADARELIARVLSDCNAQVSTASNAADALLLLQRERPHVIVSDIGMPEVDGFELLRRVRALGKGGGGRIPAIALTAFARSEDRTRALREGFQAHVPKPVEAAELIATIASVTGRADPID